MFAPDADRRPEWHEIPVEQPQLIEYDWARERKPEKHIPIELIEAMLAELEEDEVDQEEVTPGVH